MAERQGWRVSREIRLGELLTVLALLFTMLGVVRKFELRVVGMEAATRSNAESISQLVGVVRQDHDLLMRLDGGGR